MPKLRPTPVSAKCTPQARTTEARLTEALAMRQGSVDKMAATYNRVVSDVKQVRLPAAVLGQAAAWERSAGGCAGAYSVSGFAAS